MFSPDYEFEIKDFLIKNPNKIDQIVTVKITASDDIDQLNKGNFPRDLPEDRRRVSNYQLNIYDNLIEKEKIDKKFNNYLFTKGDSRDPELAGIGFNGIILYNYNLFNLVFPNSYNGFNLPGRVCSKK